MQSTKFLSMAGVVAIVGLAACGETASPATCDDACLTPPAATCNGGTLVAFNPVGTCEEGTCRYTPAQTDCTADGGTCENGACVDPVDPCEDVTCDEVPTDACEGDIAVTYAEAGTCVEGECDYGRTELDCAANGQICNNARCFDPADPCLTVVCEDEPDDICEGDVAVRYNDVGECAEGACTYTEAARVDCAADGGSCVRGRCTEGDPCEGVVCDAPPASSCDDDVTVLTYDNPGTCVDGECRYGQELVDCEVDGQVCEDGACVDPDPCIGVVCNVPPGARCEGATAVTYASAGTCTDGICGYSETRTDCAATGGRCTRGACVATNPCDGVVCNDPPAPSCDGTTGVSYRPAGTCVSGTCDYEAERFDCATIGQICSDGECISADPACEGVVCPAPPGDFCDADERYLTVYTGGSECAAGECIYETNVIDCAATGRSCVEDACVAPDRCIGIVCERDNYCEGNVAVQYTGPGTCDAGTCDYGLVEQRTNCGSVGRPCFDGQCRWQVDSLIGGELFITEVMPLPSDGGPGEGWFEIENRTGTDIDLRGMFIEGSDEGTEIAEITESFVVPARGFAIITNYGGDPNPGVPRLELDPSAFIFSQTAYDSIYLRNTNGVLAGIDFDETWPFGPGWSMEFDAAAASIGDLSNRASWCATGREAASGEFVTAGRRGDACGHSLAPGAFVITELLLQGLGSRPEDAYQWVEVYNATGADIDLGGLAVENSDGEWYTFPAGTRVSDNGYIAALSTGLPLGQFRTAFAGVVFAGAGDVVRLTFGGQIIDEVALTGEFVNPADTAYGVSGVPTAAGNDAFGAWCAQPIGVGGYVPAGTPGLANLCR